VGARVAKGTLAPEKANQTNERKGEPGHHITPPFTRRGPPSLCTYSRVIIVKRKKSKKLLYPKNKKKEKRGKGTRRRYPILYSSTGKISPSFSKLANVYVDFGQQESLLR
jgi:hypothetical protein